MCLIQIPISFSLALTNWSLPSFNDFFWLVIVGVSAITAHFTMAEAMKNDDISSIISLDYFRLPILIIIGIMMYDEEFKLIYLIGGTLIFVGNWINKKKQRTQSIKHS